MPMGLDSGANRRTLTRTVEPAVSFSELIVDASVSGLSSITVSSSLSAFGCWSTNTNCRNTKWILLKGCYNNTQHTDKDGDGSALCSLLSALCSLLYSSTLLPFNLLLIQYILCCSKSTSRSSFNDGK